MLRPKRPMSGSAKIFHMAPTTFHGMSSGSAISTRHTETHGPLRGMASAMANPRGISIRRIVAVNASCRSSASWKRGEESTCSNQRVPAQKKTLSPNVSWTEKFTTVINGMMALNATSKNTGSTNSQPF